MNNRYVLSRSLALLFVSSLLAAAGQAQENNRPPEGFLPLFNGVDLEGWTGGKTEDPVKLAAKLKAMTGDERRAYRDNMEATINKHWRVENGELISDGKGPHLVTWRQYADFEMWVDWKLMTAGGDSGIYVRDTPQVQIWDPNHKPAHSHGSDKGSGGLWNNKQNPRDPSQLADKPIGEWNRMYIRMVGPYCTVVLNGKTVVDNVVLENFFNHEKPVYAQGRIHLQTHGSETRFRNVFVRRLSSEESNTMLDKIAGDDDTFVPLFNGKDLSGWVGDTGSYEVRDGAIYCKRDHIGNLVTEKQYSDFTARLEFNTPPAGNNGLAIRTPNAEASPALDALELQVLDNNHIAYADLEGYQYHGSAYGIAPALKGYLRPAGQWNHQQVTIKGDHVVVHLNGYKILDLRLKKAAPDDHPAKTFTKGHFGFAGHDDPVGFRNIRIRELKSE
ncbi:MAG: DUF1080 domain-containing protein [Planctomycetota bacterium]